MTDVLKFKQAIQHPELIAPSVVSLLQNWESPISVEEILVAEIDPDAAGGLELCNRYGVLPEEGATCVIIEATRNKNKTLAACLALVGYQMDLNGIVKKTLNARRISLAPLDLVLQETQMEYGSITAFGLPESWPILIDARIVNVPRIIIGSGVLKSKLSLPTKALLNFPNIHILDGLAKKI